MAIMKKKNRKLGDIRKIRKVEDVIAGIMLLPCVYIFLVLAFSL